MMNEQELTRIFIGPRADQYLKKWQKNKYSFCWPALFFGIFWMLYRKMYLFSFYIFLTAMMYVYVIYMIGFQAQYSSFIAFLVPIAIALFGNFLYRTHVKSKVKAYIQNPNQSLEIFRLNGGITWSIPLMWLVIQIFLLSFFILPIIHKTYFKQPVPVAIYELDLNQETYLKD